MLAASAARSFLRSAVPKATAASARASASASCPKSKPSSCPFRVPAQKPTSQRILRQRYPVELSSSMESMLPYHSATASALLTSMLSASPRSCGWFLEGLIDDA